MTNGLGVAAIAPSATVSTGLTCVGVPVGATILQVINMVTGADVTSSFDPFVRNAGLIFQVDTVPTVADNHLISFQIPGGEPVTVKFAVVNSIGASSGTHGSVIASGVKKGDTIVRAFAPVTNFAYGSASDWTPNFAPTAPANDTVTQLDGISTADSVLLLLSNAGSPLTSFDIGTNDGSAPVTLGVSSVVAGDRMWCSLDLTTPALFTNFVAPNALRNGQIEQFGGPTSNIVLFFLLQRAAG